MFDRTSKPQHSSLLDETATLPDDTLSDNQLDQVAGGSITKSTDQSSPAFFKNAVAGAHY
jgi:hypothetical protein